MELQHITLDGVKAAARKAYDDGRLLAQLAERGRPIRYAYRMENSVCAIGAALSEETLDHIEYNGLQKLVVANEDFSEKIATFDEDEYEKLREIQVVHDAWLTEENNKQGGRDHSNKEAKEKFLQSIEHTDAEVVK